MTFCEDCGAYIESGKKCATCSQLGALGQQVARKRGIPRGRRNMKSFPLKPKGKPVACIDFTCFTCKTEYTLTVEKDVLKHMIKRIKRGGETPASNKKVVKVIPRHDQV